MGTFPSEYTDPTTPVRIILLKFCIALLGNGTVGGH